MENPQLSPTVTSPPVSIQPYAHVADTAGDDSFYTVNTELRDEIIEGILREGQICTLGGAFGAGKTPLEIDLIVCVTHGISWCGRKVQRRPVIAFDMESAAPTYKRNLQLIVERRGVALPTVPHQLLAYLANDDPKTNPLTSEFLDSLKGIGIEASLEIVKKALASKPNALVVIDPAEMLFRIDTLKKRDVLGLYCALRTVLADYPHAAVIMTFNLRKKDKRSACEPNLLSDPRDWLEEIAGSLDLMNRSDVRLGMDFLTRDSSADEGVRVINGIRRGEEMHPLLIRPVGEAPNLAGYELAPSAVVMSSTAFTPVQQGYVKSLPSEFRWADAAKVVPKSSLSRLLARAMSLGIITKDADGVYCKAPPVQH